MNLRRMVSASQKLAAFPVFLASIVLLFSSLASARIFQNSYVSFELPPNWDCKLEGTEYICISQYEKQAKEAIIILTAKEVGPSDTFPNYVQHLKTPRTLPDKTGKLVPSQVIHVRERKISDHPWVDGMHLGSEIASYYTRYLATVKDRIAILVTFSAHKDHYTKYSQDFLKAVESLRVIASKDIFESQPTNLAGGPGVGEVIGVPLGDPGALEGPGALPPEPKFGAGARNLALVLALLIGALGFYLWQRKSKKK